MLTSCHCPSVPCYISFYYCCSRLKVWFLFKCSNCPAASLSKFLELYWHSSIQLLPQVSSHLFSALETRPFLQERVRKVDLLIPKSYLPFCYFRVYYIYMLSKLIASLNYGEVWGGEEKKQNHLKCDNLELIFSIKTLKLVLISHGGCNSSRANN